MIPTTISLASGMSAATKRTPDFWRPSKKCASRLSRSILAMTRVALRSRQRDVAFASSGRSLRDPLSTSTNSLITDVQVFCRIDSPLAGIVLSDRVHFSGLRIARSDYGRLGLEFEIAVKMARDLSGGRHTVDEVSGAVEHVCPAIEIVDDRNADYSNLEALSLISDNSWNAGIVLGDFQGDWPDLAEIEGRATMDGAEIGRGQGRDVLDSSLPRQWPGSPIISQAREAVCARATSAWRRAASSPRNSQMPPLPLSVLSWAKRAAVEGFDRTGRPRSAQTIYFSQMDRDAAPV